ncbi:ABC transporter substrate-binding protein [Paenibacillus sp. URB8-2]|uniref:ABC transporter substrate-binding protein n=1 Tax=Paenibacillus sp. URB8-2 TaxID=2741301 RepID=UPI0015C10333|nr:sugar ABC transporter substrate-binding protein [Paenibacillus sp. URB8-2]BCG60949.1 ABC transporter substrate-binding protein [Paenibacillus sp. URB8-2]
MKKHIPLLLLIVFVCFTCLITSCVPLASEASGQDNRIPPPSKVKLVVWIWESAKAPLEANIAEFNREYPNIQIEFQTMKSSQLYQKFLVGTNTKDPVPDIITVESSYVQQMVNNRALYDITDQVRPYRKVMNEFKWADAISAGRYYAMPWDSGPVMLFYRRDLFELAGLPSDPQSVADTIRTWDDFYQAAKRIKEAAGVDMIMESKSSSSNRWFELMMWQRGLWYFDKQGNPATHRPEIKDLARFIVKMTNEGYVYDAKRWSVEWFEAIRQGKVATLVIGSWMDGALSKWIAPEQSGLWGVAPMPKWSLEDSYASANDGGSNLAINAYSKHPKEAWKFIEFMLGRKSSQIRTLKNGAIFPSLETIYDDPIMDEPISYFGGQPVRKLYVKAIKEIYPQGYTKGFPTATQMMTDAFAQIYLERRSVDDVMDTLSEQLKSKLDEPQSP